jgi:hypothetical protein
MHVRSAPPAGSYWQATTTCTRARPTTSSVHRGIRPHGTRAFGLALLLGTSVAVFLALVFASKGVTT